MHFHVSAQKPELPTEARTIPNYRELWANEPFAKYDPSSEIVEKRDQVSKHFRNADGTITAHIAAGPIHYWEEGQWKTIFHTIDTSIDGYLINMHNGFKTTYPKSSTGSIRTYLSNGMSLMEMQNMQMYYESNGQAVGNINIQSKSGKAEFNTLTYEGVYGENVDLRLTQHTSLRKMDYILKNTNSLNSAPAGAQFLVFEEKVEIPEGVVPRLEGNLINLYFNEKIVAQYQNPIITEGISYKNKKQKSDFIEGLYDTELNDRYLKIKLKIPMSWLLSPDRSFPIEVDPTINFLPDVASSWTGGIETARSSTDPDYTAYTGNMWSASYYSSGVNFGGTNGLSSSKIYVGVNKYNYSGTSADRQAFHSWAKFNTSTISDNSTISSIGLYTYIEYDNSWNVGIDLTKITTEPVANTASNRLEEIRNGTVYNADIQSFDNGGAAWVNYTLGGTANSDLQSLLSSDWYAVGYKSIGRVSYIDDWVRASGQAETNKPYITVIYTSVTAPTVTTTTASSIANFTASSGGNVTSDGGASVTARGVQWSTSPLSAMPSGSTTSDGTGTGSFTSSLTGLSASTVYYYRAYALNSAGYGYGTQYSFVTTGPSAEGYYISGNIVNNGEIISTYDENYLRMTGASKTITGSGKFTNSKLFADATTTFDAGLDAASAFTETFVNAGKSLTIATGRTFKNGTMGNYGTLTIAGTGIINNSSNWVNGVTGTVTFGGAGTIYAGANWTNDGTFTAGTGTVEFNGSTSGNTISGSTTFYNATINKGSSTATILDVNGTVTQTNSSANLTFTNGLLRIPSGGSWTKTSGGPTIGANSGLHVNGGTFTLNGASITNNGLFKTTTGTATIGNSSGNSITNQSGSSFIVDGAGTVNIAGRLEVTGSGNVNLSAGTVNICTSGNGSTNLGSIDMTSGTSFTMTGGAINMVQKSTGATQVDYRNLAGTVSISGGTLTIGTTATSASSNFNIQGAMPPLVVDNTTNAKTATINGASTVYGNVTINSTSSLVLNSGVTATVNGSLSNSGTYNATGTLNLAGNWVNNGTFTSNTGNSVVFNGSSASTIGGSGTDNFYNLTMSKTSATPQLEVTLADGNISVANTLTLTLGNLVTGSYITHVTNTASGAVSGGSADSYVVGKLKRAVAGANTYVFPVGKSLYEEAQLQFTSGYTSADITAFFTDASPGSLPVGGLTQSGTSLVGILDQGYWSIDPSAGAVGSPTYTVTLKETGHANGTTNAANYTVIKRQNTPSVGDWVIQGTHSNTTQSDVAGVVTAVRSGLTSFSDFGIGFGGGALPIELSSFQANCSDNNTVDVTWSTASEHNTNYFRVDKSRNGTQWDVLGTIGAAGNSTYMIDYALTDQFPNPGINYYRLTQYDLDGVFETFDVQAAVCKDQQAGTTLSTYPNPSSSDFNVDLQTEELEGEGVLMVTDAKGSVVHSQDIKIIKGNNNYIIQHFEAEPGIYYISVKAGASTVTTKHSMR